MTMQVPENFHTMVYEYRQMFYGTVIAVLCTGIYFYYWGNHTRRLKVLKTTRKFMTGDQHRSVREHMRHKFAVLESFGEEMIEERRLKATHVFRRVSLFQRRARHEGARMIRAAPRKVKEALLVRTGIATKSTDCLGDGMQKIHATIQEPLVDDHALMTEEHHMDDLIPRERVAFSSLLRYEIFKVVPTATLKRFCRGVHTRALAPGEVFREIGDTQQCLSFAAISQGSMELFTEDGELWSRQHKGRIVRGLMEVVAVILGFKEEYCVEARADRTDGCTLVIIEEEKIIELKQELEKRSEDLVRMVRMALMRHNSVTLMAAIRYLGLINECQKGSSKKTNEIPSLSPNELTDDVLVTRARTLAAQVLGIHQDRIPSIEMAHRSNDERMSESLLMGEVARNRDQQRGLRISKLDAGQSILELTNAPTLFVLVNGEAEVKSQQSETVYHVQPGGVIGQISVLSGSWDEWYGSPHGRSPVCRPVAVTESYVLHIPQRIFDRLVKTYPKIAIHCAKRIVSQQCRLIRQLDIAMEWIHVKSGEIIVNRGDRSQCMHVILNGRVRCIGENGLVVGDLARGSTIGEAEILTQARYRWTIRASRESQLCQIPAALIHVVSNRYPEVMIHLAKTISKSLLADRNIPGVVKRPMDAHSIAIAILPVTGSVPVQLFSKSLTRCISNVCSVNLLTSEVIANEFGVSSDGAFEGFDFMSDIQGISWLNAQEETHSVILYQCDWEASAWTRLCIRQADLVLLVANGADSPQFSSLEQEVNDTSNARRELVVLHVNPSAEYRPKGTREWIEGRKVTQHHHVRLYTQGTISDPTYYRSDLSRLARWLTGTSIGLVLGGGGARGTAHLGVLRALEEEGVAVDMIGGTSIGSFYGGLYAMHDNSLSIRRAARVFSNEMGGVWGYIKDFTLPLSSYFTGANFNANVQSVFAFTKIEDLWLSYFCITTDLARSCEVVHQNGTLWRYVRASMSLCGYLPPLCEKSDPEDSLHYLCDGGYINNLPADVMKEKFGASIIIAVDVSGKWNFAGENYGDSLSGWHVLWRKYNPFSKTLNVPMLADIQSQLAYVSSVKQLAEAKERCIDLYLQPAVQQYETLDFHKFKEIETIGYDHSKDAIAKWKAELTAANDYRVKIIEWSQKGSRNIARSRSFT